MDLIVLAKEPTAGRVKTRLCPPCSPVEAAAVAEAALADTLDAAMGSGADRVVVALDGRAGPWCPPGIEIVDQGQGSLADRLATAWRTVRGPALQIGMDTPQADGDILTGAMVTLATDPVDAVLGRALDGGWWAIGFTQPRPEIFAGIATSQDDTGERQLARMIERGLITVELTTLRDVDRWIDALAVAAERPEGRFARAVHDIERRIRSDH